VIALLVLAAVELPLGPFARPGVPVLLASDEPAVADLAGWTWRVDGPTEVAPPQLPCTVRLEEGSLALEPVPEGRVLVGSLRAGREDAVPIRLVRGMHWRTLDVFDRIVAGPCEPWERTILDAWARAGGDVVDGAVSAPAAPLPVPRAGNVLPEIYDLATARGEGSAAHELARPLALGMAAAFALLLLAGARGRLSARAAVLLCLVVGLAGGAAGAWLTRGAAEPFSEALVRIHYPGRTREFHFVQAEWDGAEREAPPGVPFFYRGAGDPWWDGPGRVLLAGEGIVRGFVRDVDPVEPLREGGSEMRRILRRVFRSQLPGDADPRWWWGTEAFQGGNRPVKPILEIEAGRVR